MVAVATKVEGFTTMAALVPAFAFHAIASAVGMQLLTAAAKRSDAEREARGEGAAATQVTAAGAQ